MLLHMDMAVKHDTGQDSGREGLLQQSVQFLVPVLAERPDMCQK